MKYCSWIYNLISQLRTVTKTSTRNFFIIRHSCHRCIYILVVVIIIVFALFFQLTITSFTETYLLFLFLVLFRRFWPFSNGMIFKSAPETFAICTFRPLFIRITSCTGFYLLLYYTFEMFFCIIFGTSTKIALCMNNICSFTVFPSTWTSVKI